MIRRNGRSDERGQKYVHPFPGEGGRQRVRGGKNSRALTHVEGGESGRGDVKLKRKIGWKKKQTDVI